MPIARTPIAIRNEASRLADVANKDANLLAITGTVLDAHEEVKKGPLAVMHWLVKVYPGDAFNDFPVPGSTGDANGNKPVDRYVETVTEDGKTKQKKGNFYTDFCRSLKEGQDIEAIKAEISKARKGEASDDFKEYSTLQLDQLLNRMNNRFNALTQLYRRAVQLQQHIVLHREMFGDTCIIGYSKDDNGEVENYTTPIYIQKKADPTKVKAFSVGGFLALDPNVAKEKGGSWEEVTNSAKRAGNGGSTEGNAIKNMNDLESVLAGIAHYLDNDGKAGAKLIAKARSDRAFLLTYGRVCMALDDAWSTLQDDYRKAEKAVAQAAA